MSYNKPMNYTFRTIIEPDGNMFHGYVPALPGCHTCGATLTETQENLHEAMQLYIESLQADGEAIPLDRGFESIQTVTLAPTYA